jgi:hypothetical protein
VNFDEAVRANLRGEISADDYFDATRCTAEGYDELVAEMGLPAKVNPEMAALLQRTRGTVIHK